MPPIPEDAVVIADYMLMADFVVQAAGKEKISKGVRMQSHSRDIRVDALGTSGTRLIQAPADVGVMGLVFENDGVLTGGGATRNIDQRLPYFGTDFLINHQANRIGTVTENLNSDAGTSANISTSGFDGLTKHTGNALGVNEMKAIIVNGQNDDRAYTWASYYATPIHTSSHYQTFETPFLHELVGGDRNMEQNNLIVTPDGKTWDEVTRDTSYLGKICVVSTWDTGNDTADGAAAHNMTEWRGKDGSCNVGMMNKDFAIAFDRVYCLVSGEYHIMGNAKEDDAGNQVDIRINGSMIQSQIATPAGQSGHNTTSVLLKRGDYVQLKGRSNHFKEYNRFIITRV